MKKFSLVKALVTMLVCGLLLCGCGTEESKVTTTTGTTTSSKDADAQTKEEAKQEASGQDSEAAEGEYLSGKYLVDIVMKDLGTIRVELDADVAPITVTNFIELVEADFYDGLTLHRIMDGFMMQGGDPTGTGRGGSSETIKGEFAANGVENNLSHTRGAISMARTNKPNSASSQFFIVHEDSTFLDGQYACFGYVIEGMEIVDEICKNAIVEDNNGTVLPENQPIIESISVVEE